MIGTLVVGSLVGWYASRLYYHQSMQSTQKDLPLNHKKTDSNDNDNRNNVIQQVTNDADYFQGYLTYGDLIYLINVALALKRLPAINYSDDLPAKIVTKMIQQRLARLLDSQEMWDRNSLDYGKGLKLLSLLPHPRFGDYFNNVPDKSRKTSVSQNLLEAKIRAYLWPGNLNNIIRSLSHTKKIINSPKLQNGEHLVYIGTGYLYQDSHKGQMHPVSYQEVSDKVLGKLPTKSDNAQDNDNLRPIASGTLFLTTQRLVIKPSVNETAEQKYQRSISLNTIQTCFQDGRKICLNRGGDEFYLSVGLPDQFDLDPSLDIDTETINCILNGLIHPGPNSELPIGFSISELGELKYYPFNWDLPNNLQNTGNQKEKIKLPERQIERLFDKHVLCTCTWRPNDESAGDMQPIPMLHITIPLTTDSNYFCNLILNRPKEWLAKNRNLIELQNETAILLPAERRNSFKLQIIDQNFPNQVNYTLFEKLPLNSNKSQPHNSEAQNIYKNLTNYVRSVHNP